MKSDLAPTERAAPRTITILTCAAMLASFASVVQSLALLGSFWLLGPLSNRGESLWTAVTAIAAAVVALALDAFVQRASWRRPIGVFQLRASGIAARLAGIAAIFALFAIWWIWLHPVRKID